MDVTKRTLCVLLSSLVWVVALAQNNTNSPYTRYGLGEIKDPLSANNIGMGGVAFGVRDRLHANPANPASYTAIDSLTFIFEGGATLQNMLITDGMAKFNARNSSVDYFTTLFRLAPRVGMSVGLVPFSNVGYATSDLQTEEGGLSYQRSFAGDGGYRVVYMGVSVRPFKGLSVGINGGFLWGSATRTAELAYPAQGGEARTYRSVTELRLNDYKIDLGVQYELPLRGDKDALTLGAVYTPGHKLHGKYKVNALVNVGAEEVGRPQMTLPHSVGLGATYKRGTRWLLGADYSLQVWSKAQMQHTAGAAASALNSVFDYTDRHKVSLGVQYLPNIMGRKYFQLMRYSAGMHYATPYYRIKGEPAQTEYGVSLGMELPLPRSRSSITLAGQYVHREPAKGLSLKEDIFRLSIGVTFNERWFSKSQVD